MEYNRKQLKSTEYKWISLIFKEHKQTICHDQALFGYIVSWDIMGDILSKKR